MTSRSSCSQPPKRMQTPQLLGAQPPSKPASRSAKGLPPAHLNNTTLPDNQPSAKDAAPYDRRGAIQRTNHRRSRSEDDRPSNLRQTPDQDHHADTTKITPAVGSPTPNPNNKRQRTPRSSPRPRAERTTLRQRNHAHPPQPRIPNINHDAAAPTPKAGLTAPHGRPAGTAAPDARDIPSADAGAAERRD